MSIGGKKFTIKYSDGIPELNLDLTISSPNPSIKKSRQIKNALIDTGSDITCIPKQLVKELSLIPTGDKADIEDFNDGVETILFYSAKITIDSVIIDEIVKVGASKKSAIIGLDLLIKWQTLIDGPDGTFEISAMDRAK